MFDIINAHPEVLPLIYLLVGTAAVDTLSGIYAAVAGGTFNLKFIDGFVFGHLFKKVTPILLLAFAGVTVSAEAGAVLMVTALTAAGAYEIATIKSVMDNFSAAATKAGNVPDDVALVAAPAVLVD